MIKIKFQKKNDKIVYFKISGHANAGEYGEDIVCAAVSSVVQMTLNGLIEIVKIKTLKYEMKEGLIVCDLKENSMNEYSETTNVLLKSMYSFLEAISQEYPKNIKMIIEEV